MFVFTKGKEGVVDTPFFVQSKVTTDQTFSPSRFKSEAQDAIKLEDKQASMLELPETAR